MAPPAASAVLALVLLQWPASGLQEPNAGAALLDFEWRRDAVLAQHARDPFPSPECPVGKPDEGSCIWGQITLAHAILAARHVERPQTSEAWRLLRSAVERTSASLAARSESASPQRDRPQATAGAVDFAFLTSVLLFRIAGAFGASVEAEARLPDDLHAAIHEVFWAWAASECSVEQARPEFVLRPQGSENLDLQRVHACWAAAELLAQEPATGGRVYRDGSSPSAQRTAWTAYLKRYLQAKAASGLLVEYFSPVYSKYVLDVLCNLFDFASDDDLRRLAGDSMTFWWALWAQEQIAGLHGGSKARSYPPRTVAGATPVSGLPWVYFGLGAPRPEVSHPANFPLLTTRYRVPEVVADIATDAAGRVGYEVWTRQLGLAAGPVADQRYVLSPDLVVTRYTFATPDYVMGASIVPRLPAARWTAISSQNRWNGVVLADGPDARVHATPAPQGGRSTYNAALAAQSRGTQIVQRLPPPFSRSAGDMAIWVGPRLRRVEREGWIFVEGSAYVAVRPAFGGYAADPAQPSFRLLDQRSPVIIQAGTRAAHADFKAFQAAVLAAPLRADPQEVSFQGLDGAGRLRFFLDSDRRPEVDGRPIEAPAGWVLHSPFVRQALGSGTVEIGKGPRTLQLRFD